MPSALCAADPFKICFGHVVPNRKVLAENRRLIALFLCREETLSEIRRGHHVAKRQEPAGRILDSVADTPIEPGNPAFRPCVDSTRS